MIVGVDFDNTIARYHDLFHELALEEDLVPPDTEASKTAIRDYMRANGIEDEWTRLQGIAYGPRIGDADLFEGVKDALQQLRAAGAEVHIVSHKTRRPYSEDDYDLHAAAREFLADRGFHEAEGPGIPTDHVHLETSKEAKIDRVRSLGCTHFVDDLPELLQDPRFPESVDRILFDPQGQHPDTENVTQVQDWKRLPLALGVTRDRA